jgi:hypothetical protein
MATRPVLPRGFKASETIDWKRLAPLAGVYEIVEGRKRFFVTGLLATDRRGPTRGQTSYPPRLVTGRVITWERGETTEAVRYLSRSSSLNDWKALKKSKERSERRTNNRRSKLTYAQGLIKAKEIIRWRSRQGRLPEPFASGSRMTRGADRDYWARLFLNKLGFMMRKKDAFRLEDEINKRRNPRDDVAILLREARRGNLKALKKVWNMAKGNRSRSLAAKVRDTASALMKSERIEERWGLPPGTRGAIGRREEDIVQIASDADEFSFGN